jgi:hypothetical protein
MQGSAFIWYYGESNRLFSLAFYSCWYVEINMYVCKLKSKLIQFSLIYSSRSPGGKKNDSAAGGKTEARR